MDALGKIPREPVRKALPIKEYSWWNENKIWIISLSCVVLFVIGASHWSTYNYIFESSKEMSCHELLKQINFPHKSGYLENWAESIMQDEYDGRCKN